MDVREKLIELIGSTEYGNGSLVGNNFQKGFIEKIASHLIANGVTVQELHGCEHCRATSYTENQFTVITQMGREVKTQFNFCPNCGRRLQHTPKGE